MQVDKFVVQYEGLQEVLYSHVVAELKKTETWRSLKQSFLYLDGSWQTALMALIESVYANSVPKTLKNLNEILSFNVTTQAEKNVKQLLQEFSRVYLTGLRAQEIHSFVLEVLLDQEVIMDEVKEKELAESFLFPEAPLLARAWVYLDAVSKKLPMQVVENVPNHVFYLLRKEIVISFIRMPSPHNESNNRQLSPHYLAMLEDYKRHQWRHIDLCLIRLKSGGNQQTIAKARYHAQTEKYFEKTLLVWCFDVYSNFIEQNKKYHQENQVAVDFIKELNSKFFNSGMHVSCLPKNFRESSRFNEKVNALLSSLHEDVFFFKEQFSLEERRDFCLLALVVILEEMIELFHPRTVMATCMAHIDRGMMVTTLLFVYALIKSQEYSLERLQALWMMIFPPSLLFDKRPTHFKIMKRILSLLSRLHQQQVIQNLFQRKTYFSNFNCITA